MSNYNDIEISGKTNIVKETTISMNRTLLIGVGGSGKEVLLRLRRKFYESKKNSRGYDFIEYLWIDTDARNVDIMQNKYDIINDKLQLSEEDILNVSMQSDELKKLYGNMNQYPHIQKWFNKEELEKLGYSVLAQGASAIRPFGRLAFWWRVNDIEKKIREKIQKLERTTLNTDSSIKLSGPANIEIYIVGSLAGGTGSGMFLDLGFLLEKISSNYVRNAFLFLSDVFDSFDSQKDIRSANCYAALQELNFYMDPQNERLKNNQDNIAFSFDWGKGDSRDIKLPVFTSTYLISNKYSNGELETIVTDPFDMVADYLFLDFDPSSFGQQKRSSRTNARHSADMKAIIRSSIENQTIVYPFSCGYQVFGIGQIRLNISKRKNWAQYKYLNKIFELMKANDLVNNAAIQKQNGDFILQEELSYKTLLSSLERQDNPVSITNRIESDITEKINNMIQKGTDRLEVNANNINKLTNDLSSIIKSIEKELYHEKENLQSKLESNVTSKGEIIRIFEENQKMVINKVKSRLLNLFYSLLGDFENNGIQTNDSFIKRCIEALDQIQKKIQESSSRYDGYEDDFSGLDEFTIDNTHELIFKRLEQCKEIPFFMFGFKKQAEDYFENKIDSCIGTIRNSSKEYISKNVKLIKENFLTWFRKQYSEVCNRFLQNMVYDLKSFIQDEANSDSLAYRLKQYRNNVENYFDYSERYMNSFVSEEINPKRRLVLDKYVEWDKLYQKYIELNITSSDLAEKTVTYFSRFNDYNKENLQITDNLQKLSYLLTKVNNRLLIESIEHSAEDMFENFLNELSVSKKLSELFNQNVSDTNSSIEDVIKHAIFKLPFEKYNGEINDNLNGSSYKTVINACPSDDLDIVSMINSVSRPNGEETFVNHSSKEHISFFIESGGYPLFYISSLNSIKNEFLKNVSNDPQNIYKRYLTKSFSHIKNLLPPYDTKEIKQYLDDVFPVVKGVVMKEIQYKPAMKEDSHSYFYISYIDRQNISKKHQLGQTIEQMVELLTKNYDLKDEIINLIEKSESFDTVQLLDFYKAINLNLQQIADQRITHNNEVDPIEYSLRKLEEDIRANIVEQKLDSGDYETEEEAEQFIRQQVAKIKSSKDKLPKINYCTSELKEGFYTI